MGTTSACAENTVNSQQLSNAHRNYLRVRGEYQSRRVYKLRITELPPRARRIQESVRAEWKGGGTTSACAENTPLEGAPYVWGGNYLRVRGEYRQPGRIISNIAELPPRARRIRDSLDDLGLGQGTTSACAENTTDDPRYMQRSRNYLRVRGEYVRHVQPVESCEELPPRARRIHCNHNVILTFPGTTSACAENTRLLMVNQAMNWNYLRVRGEYDVYIIHSTPSEELPPRARRILLNHIQCGQTFGTTSACAENTKPHPTTTIA